MQVHLETERHASMMYDQVLLVLGTPVVKAAERLATAPSPLHVQWDWGPWLQQVWQQQSPPNSINWLALAFNGKIMVVQPGSNAAARTMLLYQDLLHLNESQLPMATTIRAQTLDSLATATTWFTYDGELQ
jgi:hypothetical protein